MRQGDVKRWPRASSSGWRRLAKMARPVSVALAGQFAIQRHFPGANIEPSFQSAGHPREHQSVQYRTEN